jgi:RNA polymerase sigma factor (sigma-70 family)
MTFPDTRQTLIHRLVHRAGEEDWRLFFADYWPAVYRFALRHDGVGAEDAEDIASQTFEALWKNRLLARWTSAPSSKLRTLIAGVVRKVIANRLRVQANRRRLLREDRPPIEGRPPMPLPATPQDAREDHDAFYAAWVEQIVQQAVEALFAEYHRAGKGDYFRVLHGRICEGMTLAEIARALGITQSQAENHYKHARTALAKRLEACVRLHVRRYTPDADFDSELRSEWNHLGAHLKQHGGLEQAVARAYQHSLSPGGRKAMTTSLNAVLRASGPVSPV